MMVQPHESGDSSTSLVRRHNSRPSLNATAMHSSPKVATSIAFLAVVATAAARRPIHTPTWCEFDAVPKTSGWVSDSLQ